MALYKNFSRSYLQPIHVTLIAISVLILTSLLARAEGSKNSEFAKQSVITKDSQETMGNDSNKLEEDFFSPEDSPVSEESTTGQRGLTAARQWRNPDYSGQEQAVGYGPQVFYVPPGIEKNYRFWMDIYTKYSTDEGLIHDSEYIDLVYEVLDFRPIMTKPKWGPIRKDVEKRNLVNRTKKKWINILKRLSKVKTVDGADPEGLTPEEKRVWDYFKNISEKKKFVSAQSIKRLRFQLGQRDRFIQAIFFSGRYLEDFESVFREAGLPIELTRLPFVESSFNVLARSKVGASGVWQLMPETAKPYFKQSKAVDLRNHPLEAAIVATKFLRQSFLVCKSWPLALTGYNHGPQGVMKLARKYQSREIGELVEKVKKSSAFGFASKNFYASFLAALESERNAPKYFGSVVWSSSLDSVDLHLEKAIRYSDLVRWLDQDDLKTQIYNPHISVEARKGKVKIPPGNLVSVPRARYEFVIQELKKESPRDSVENAQKTQKTTK